jgi:hypothetical protein
MSSAQVVVSVEVSKRLIMLSSRRATVIKGRAGGEKVIDEGGPCKRTGGNHKIPPLSRCVGPLPSLAKT